MRRPASLTLIPLILLIACFIAPVAGAEVCDPGASVTGTTPLTVNFTDVSNNTPTSWVWSFNDVAGNNTWIQFATTEDSSLTFNTGGNYSIRLNATNGDGTDSVNGGFVNVSEGVVVAPFANFTTDRTTVPFPRLLYVVDTSNNTPTSWVWHWGDGTANTTGSASASHQYTIRGRWNMSLTVSNDAGQSTKYQLIRVFGYA